MYVPKAFRGQAEVLLERDRRSGKIEIGNAEKEGDCTLHFSFPSGPVSAPMVLVLLPRG